VEVEDPSREIPFAKSSDLDMIFISALEDGRREGDAMLEPFVRI